MTNFIPFTQYVLPNGRKLPVRIELPSEIVAKAQTFINSGGWFECEVLTTGHVSLTACAVVEGEPQDIAIEVIPNGPGTLEAVDRLVTRAVATIG